MAAATAAPAKPPVAAAGVKAWVKISPIAAGTAAMLMRMISSAAPRYSTIIAGTSRPATSAIRRMPPMTTTPTSAATIMPVSQGGTPKLDTSAAAMELTWTALPIPNAAIAPKIANASPSHLPSSGAKAPTPFRR